MRNVLAFLAALILLLSGVGWWRAWYSVGGLPAETGRVAFRIEIDAMKVGADVLELARRAQRSLPSRTPEDKANAPPTP